MTYLTIFLALLFVFGLGHHIGKQTGYVDRIKDEEMHKRLKASQR